MRVAYHIQVKHEYFNKLKSSINSGIIYAFALKSLQNTQKIKPCHTLLTEKITSYNEMWVSSTISDSISYEMDVSQDRIVGSILKFIPVCLAWKQVLKNSSSEENETYLF